MAKQLSRRRVISAAVSSALAAGLAPLAAAQDKPAEEDPHLNDRVDALEKKLAKPLSAQAKKLTRESLKNLEAEMADRLKTKLPENSEPCFVYIPTPVRERRR